MKISAAEGWAILFIFLVSRLVVRIYGIHMDMQPLYQYWQYLDVYTLRENLLRGVWYDHAQPPGFNLLLGVVLKLFGVYAPIAFDLLFKAITLINSFLILYLAKVLSKQEWVARVLALWYILSPATMIYECELFYTCFVSMTLLASLFFLRVFYQRRSWLSATGCFSALLLLCMTRSLYHLLWLAGFLLVILGYFRREPGFRKLLVGSCISVVLVTGWYVKNYMIFGIFSPSSWVGMNLARNVFHDNESQDSSRIESIMTFSPVPAYRSFIQPGYQEHFAGLQDRDLMGLVKNDSFLNANHVQYIAMSKLYMTASLRHIQAHPLAYLRNVFQSACIFFTPATSYLYAQYGAGKIKYYDLFYSFNLAQLVRGKRARRIALSIAEIPKVLLYVVVFLSAFRNPPKDRWARMACTCMVVTIGFVFVVSSLLEHAENMRFRYEIEPLFLLLLALVLPQWVSWLASSRRKGSGLQHPSNAG